MDDGPALVKMASSLFNAGYGTAIGSGLYQGQAALNTGALARPSARKALLLLSDGNNDYPPDPVAAAAAARAAGTEVFIVAVGAKRNMTALEAMASPPIREHLFESEDYQGLLAALHNATSALCDRYVCVDEAVCVPAPPGHTGVPLGVCNATCHPPAAEQPVVASL